MATFQTFWLRDEPVSAVRVVKIRNRRSTEWCCLPMSLFRTPSAFAALHERFSDGPGRKRRPEVLATELLGDGSSISVLKTCFIGLLT